MLQNQTRLKNNLNQSLKLLTIEALYNLTITLGHPKISNHGLFYPCLTLLRTQNLSTKRLIGRDLVTCIPLGVLGNEKDDRRSLLQSLIQYTIKTKNEED